MKCRIMWRFIWICTVCKSSRFGISRIQSVKRSKCISLMLNPKPTVIGPLNQETILIVSTEALGAM